MDEWVLLIPYACRPPRVALELCKDSCSNGVGVVCHSAVGVDSSVSSFPSAGVLLLSFECEELRGVSDDDKMLLMVLMRARLCEKNQRENRERGRKGRGRKKFSSRMFFNSTRENVTAGKFISWNTDWRSIQGPRLLEIPAMFISPDAFSSISGDRGRETLVRLIELLVPDDPAADEEAPARLLLLPEMLFSGAAAAAPAAVAFSTTCA